jgi:FdhD protein
VSGITQQRRVERHRGPLRTVEADALAVEAPLAIRVRVGDAPPVVVTTTMRTPGDDEELALGCLVGEGVLAAGAPVPAVQGCGGAVDVQLPAGTPLDATRFDRVAAGTAACGACGRRDLDAWLARAAAHPVAGAATLLPEVLYGLPARLAAAQAANAVTGGLHAVGAFGADGQLLAVREDVGRHNAADKVVGALFAAGRLPLTDGVLVLSGRASFELLQKAAAAGASVVAAIGAPSSLAVELAERAGITLVGFLAAGRCNVYTHPDRIGGAA